MAGVRTRTPAAAVHIQGKLKGIIELSDEGHQILFEFFY
jgi:hypothetical protein